MNMINTNNQKFKMKKIIFCLVFFAISSCSQDFGTKKVYKNLELYFTVSVTENEADSLADYLLKEGWGEGNIKTIQLNRNQNIYEVKIVCKKGIEEDQEYIERAKLMAYRISQAVFQKHEVDIHLCDDYLNTIRVVPMSAY